MGLDFLKLREKFRKKPAAPPPPARPKLRNDGGGLASYYADGKIYCPVCWDVIPHREMDVCSACKLSVHAGCSDFVYPPHAYVTRNTCSCCEASD